MDHAHHVGDEDPDREGLDASEPAEGATVATPRPLASLVVPARRTTTVPIRVQAAESVSVVVAR